MFHSQRLEILPLCVLESTLNVNLSSVLFIFLHSFLHPTKIRRMPTMCQALRFEALGTQHRMKQENNSRPYIVGGREIRQ